MELTQPWGIPGRGTGTCLCVLVVGWLLLHPRGGQDAGSPWEAGAGAQVCIMAQGVSHVLVTGQALGCAVLCWDREQPRPPCGAGSPDRHLPPAVVSMLLCYPSVEHEGWGHPNPQSPPGVAHGVQGRRGKENVWDQNITMAMTSQKRCNLGQCTLHHPALPLPPHHAAEEERDPT